MYGKSNAFKTQSALISYKRLLIFPDNSQTADIF